MYAFVHIDKTAGTTLKSILRRSFGVRHCDIRLPRSRRHLDGLDHQVVIDATDLRRVQRLYRNLVGFAGHNVKAYAELAWERPDIRFFTILRDPVARFRSHFLNRSRSFLRNDFECWTAETWVHNWQAKMIAGEPNAQKAIDLLSTRIGFVGLTERFDESLILLGPWLREPGYSPLYRRLNQYIEKGHGSEADRKREATRYLDTELARGRMQECNIEDQKVYDYVATILFAQQVARHSGDFATELCEFQRQQQAAGALKEAAWSRFVRNCVYKPLAHLRVA